MRSKQRRDEAKAAKAGGVNMDATHSIPLDLIPDKMPPGMTRYKAAKLARLNGHGAHAALPSGDRQARMVLVYAMLQFLNGGD